MNATEHTREEKFIKEASLRNNEKAVRKEVAFAFRDSKTWADQQNENKKRFHGSSNTRRQIKKNIRRCVFPFGICFQLPLLSRLPPSTGE